MEESEKPALKDNIFVLVSTCVVYAFIFVFGLMANLRVIYSVLNRRSKQTVVNVLMVNLALANILLCLFVLPIFTVLTIMKSWPFGSFLCHLWPCIYYSIRYTSMLTLASMSLLRYWIFVNSIEQSIATRKLIVFIVFIWFVSFMISLPRGIFQQELEDDKNNRFYLCLPRWPSDSNRKNYYMTTFIVLMVVPSIAVIYCLVVMFKISYLTTLKNATHVRRTNRLIFTLAIVNCVCWMPISVFEVLPENSRSECNEIVLRVVNFMAMSCAYFTPLSYIWINKADVEKFFVPWPCFKPRSNQSNNEEVEKLSTNSIPTML